eukprot:gene4511-7889_t
MSDKFNLYYFNGAGRAECARIIFKMAGVEFNDIRLDWQDFATKKAEGFFPHSCMPMLEKGDFKLNGSASICHYLGKKFNLWPENAEDDAQALSTFLFMEDTRSVIYGFFFAKDDQAKEENYKKGAAAWEKFEGNFLKLLGDKKFFFGDKFNVLDFIMFEYLGAFPFKAKYPVNEKIQKYYDNIAQQEIVVEYLKK